MKQFKNVSKKSRCKICDKPDWCSESIDGEVSICRRIQRQGAIRKVDSSGCEFYLYFTNRKSKSRGRK